MLQLLAYRVIQPGDRPHPLGHRRDPRLAQRQPVAQRRTEPGGPLVGEVGRVGLQNLGDPLVEQLRSRPQGGILGLAGGGGKGSRRSLGGGAGLRDGGNHHCH